MAHEMVHIWIGEDGASTVSADARRLTSPLAHLCGIDRKTGNSRNPFQVSLTG
jgi:hypothetical protein